MVWWIIGGVALVLLVAVWLLLTRRRKKRLEIERNAEDRLREEALDRILVGNLQDGKRGTLAFDVKYDQEQRNKKGGSTTAGQVPVMLQLTEKSKLSTRKYMLHAEGRLTIGSQANSNDIVISGPNIAKCQCEIVRIGKSLYVSNRGERGQMLLKRGKKQMILESEAVELHNNDVLYIGDYTYKATILRD